MTDQSPTPRWVTAGVHDHREPHDIVKDHSTSANMGGLTLHTLVLRREPDVVSLCRRARMAAEEFALDARDIQRFTAALFEVGLHVCAVAPGTRVDLTIDDGPSLAAHIHLADIAPLGGRQELEQWLRPLKTTIHELRLADEPPGILLSIGILFRRDLQGMPAKKAPVKGRTRREPTPAPAVPTEEHAALRGAYDELQRELQETNRGVVALYAELDDQAERLRVAEDRLRLLLDSVHDYAICMLSPEGEVTSWNHGAERLFGYASDEIIGRSFSAFYIVADRDDQMPAAHLVAAEGAGRLETEGLRLRKGGSAFDAHVILTPVRDGDRSLRGFSLVVRDVTERKRLEDDLRRRAEDLAAANRAKEDFLATLSHELRTPLNAMLGWTRLLRMGKLDQSGVARALETIERNAHLQEQLIADILDVSRIVTGKLRLELRHTDLAPLVDASIDALRPAADAKGVELRTHLGFAGSVLGDPDRLQQVVWNLLSNAVKFTPTGGRVTISLDRQSTSAVVTVSDTGEGIDPDLLPFVFDRFRQGDASVTRPHGGLGLGLSIVRHIVELHGGRVQVFSAGRGMGATFSVHLPVRAIRRALDARSGVKPLQGLRVLVVDDEADAREVVSQALSECGADTASASSVKEALEVLSDFRPDVLVSDLRMPGEDGYALIQRVRQMPDGGFGDVPAIALTGLVHPEDQRRALTAGYQSYVPKPVEVDELATLIQRVARRSASR